MKLRDLQAQFIRREIRDGHVYFAPVKRIAKAQGVRFLCPKCFAKKKGPAGVHGIICWSRSRGIPDDAEPGPGRWALKGSCIDDLSLMADPPSKARSVQLDGGCGWHGHVTNGEAA